MKENKNVKCDPCERDFEHKIGELVKEGKSPTHEAREKREHEVKAAFGRQHPAGHAEMHHPGAKPAEMHSASKPAGKYPAGAGAAKMKK